MKKKKISTFTGFGIGSIIVLALIMIVYCVIKFDDKVFYMSILEGALRVVCTIFGAALVYLALFFVFYAAAKLSPMIYNEGDEEEDYMELFTRLSNPLSICCFLVAYIVIFLEI